jgi:hypothetical protein
MRWQTISLTGVLLLLSVWAVFRSCSGHESGIDEENEALVASKESSSDIVIPSQSAALPPSIPAELDQEPMSSSSPGAAPTKEEIPEPTKRVPVAAAPAPSATEQARSQQLITAEREAMERRVQYEEKIRELERELEEATLSTSVASPQ